MPLMVYEAINETLQETFVGASNTPLYNLRSRHPSDPPGALAHWKFGEHKIYYREVEAALSDADAMPFITNYARSISKAGWRVITEA